MDTNPLHNAMIKYVCEKQMIMLAGRPDSWWKFKKIDGVRLAHNHTVADLAKIFQMEILPNIRDYECVARDPIVDAYVGPFSIVVPDNGFNINDYPDISSVNVFEAQRNKDELQDNLNVKNPIVTDDIISISHSVSTQTEIERGSVFSRGEMVARLNFIQNEIRNGVNFKMPTMENLIKYHETVAAMHNIDGTVRLSDIMEKNLEAITPQNLPQILLDSNIITEQNGSADTQYLSIFGISDASVSCAEQRPPSDHHRYSDMLQSTTIDSCNPDLHSNIPSASSVFTVNESVPQIVEIPPQETTANEVETIANVDMDEIPSGNSKKFFSPLNWDDLPFATWNPLPIANSNPLPSATCNASSRVVINKRRPLTSKQSRRQKMYPKLLPDGARPLKAKRPILQARPAISITSPRRLSKKTVPLATKHDFSIAPVAQGEGSGAQQPVSGIQVDRSPPTNYEVSGEVIKSLP